MSCAYKTEQFFFRRQYFDAKQRRHCSNGDQHAIQIRIMFGDV